MVPANIDWPELLRSFRKSNGLKQEAAAGLLGISQATLSRWECGTTAPTVAAQNRLFSIMRRKAVPFETARWAQVFRKWLCPACITDRLGVIQAVTGPFARTLNAPGAAIEGHGFERFLKGETLELRQLNVEAGIYTGRVASSEACVRTEVEGQSGSGFYCHTVGWPVVAEDGEILFLHQSARVTDNEARAIRRRLGGLAQYTYH